MSEATVTEPTPAPDAEEAEQAEQAEQATEEQTVTPIEDQPWYDDVFPILFAKLEGHASHVNSEVAWLKAHSSDLLTVIEGIEADESDEKVKAANAEIERLKNELLKVEGLLRDYAKGKAEKVIAERDDADAIAEHEAAHAKARTAYRDYLKVFKSNYEDADLTPYLPEVANLTRKGSSTGSTGGNRMRGFTLWEVDGKRVGGNVKGVFTSTASDAAREAKVDLSELQNEYKRLHGDDPKAWPTVANFTFKDHKFSAHREDKDAAKPSADVSPSANESTNGQATS